MTIREHYLLNLRRRTDRLNAWLGWQHAQLFNFKNLTIVEALDGIEYATVGEVAAAGVELGWLEFAPLTACEHTDTKLRCLLAGAIGGLQILKSIAEDKKGWYCFWEDDCVLTVDFIDFLKTKPPKNAKVLQVAKNHRYLIPDAKDSRLTKDGKFFRGARYLNLDNEYYDGWCFSQCFAVTPSGAQLLIDTYISEIAVMSDYLSENAAFDSEGPGFYFERLLMKNPDLPQTYTTIEPVTRLLWINAPDIFSENAAVDATWRAVSLSNV